MLISTAALFCFYKFRSSVCGGVWRTLVGAQRSCVTFFTKFGLMMDRLLTFRRTASIE